MRRRNRALLPILLLLPVLLSGCSVLDTLTGGSGSSGGAATPGPSATPWMVTTQGSATPSLAPSYPAGTPSTDPTGFLPLPSGTATPYPAPSATCPAVTYSFADINALSVTTTATSGTATWYNIGGYNLVMFRMTAISQDLRTGYQRDVGWVKMVPSAPCGQVSMTLKGLDRKTHYVFEVDAVVTRRIGDGTHAGTVFRSSSILTK